MIASSSLAKPIPWVFTFLTHVNIKLHICMIEGANVCVYAHTQIYFLYCEGFMQRCILMVDFPKAQTSFSE